MRSGDFVGSVPNRKSGTAKPYDYTLRKKHLKWLYGFLIATFVLQAAIVPTALYPVRTLLRVALFGASIAMLVAPLGKQRRLPVTGGVFIILAILGIGFVNPDTNSPLSAIAAIGLNLAIIAPVLWVSRMRIDGPALEGVLMLLWAFNFASTVYGVLEVVQPGRFSRESSITTEMMGEAAEGLKVTLADGTKVYRPMGLTDSPGGACRSGFFAVILGSFFFYRSRRRWLQGLLLAGIVGGLFCIYLSQVRSMLVLTAIVELVVIAMLIRRGEIGRAVSLAVVLSALTAVATLWAFTIGGDQVAQRVKTLSEGSATSVYYSNRGIFLEATLLNHAPKYPLGAGLGRWGMVNAYFGDRSGRAAPVLWAEIQPTAWIYDGGLPLAMVYYIVIIVCCQFSYRIASNRRDLLGSLAVLVLAHNLAILFNTFSYVPFIGQSGLYFWLLNACLMTAVLNRDNNRTSARLIPYRPGNYIAP